MSLRVGILAIALAAGLLPATAQGKVKKIPVKIVITNYSNEEGATVSLESNVAKCVKAKTVNFAAESTANADYVTDIDGFLVVPPEDLGYGLFEYEAITGTLKKGPRFGPKNHPKQCKGDTVLLDYEKSSNDLVFDYDFKANAFSGSLSSPNPDCANERTVAFGYDQGGEVIVDGTTITDSAGIINYTPINQAADTWYAGVQELITGHQLLPSGDAVIELCDTATAGPVSTTR